eukprot:CAMPEP_0182573090 /NCGR_PEP_ID=MMETSP1324-20130603/18158_1 /TAXON_ID=236786 /ORGANISM="Florenciella sp., Strain RCC1587" /LENGTH=32 /DNA_ID= /DNA_START= /DNA_END= /DNA_ORIENTATION=
MGRVGPAFGLADGAAPPSTIPPSHHPTIPPST